MLIRLKMREKICHVWWVHSGSVLECNIISLVKLIYIQNLLLPQAKMTLNILSPSNVQQQILADVHMFGQHCYYWVLFTPMGCTVQMHNKPSVRKSWDPNTIKGYYLCTSREHFHCFNIWTKDTKSKQNLKRSLLGESAKNNADHYRPYNCPARNATENIEPTTM